MYRLFYLTDGDYGFCFWRGGRTDLSDAKTRQTEKKTTPTARNGFYRLLFPFTFGGHLSLSSRAAAAATVRANNVHSATDTANRHQTTTARDNDQLVDDGRTAILTDNTTITNCAQTRTRKCRLAAAAVVKHPIEPTHTLAAPTTKPFTYLHRSIVIIIYYSILSDGDKRMCLEWLLSIRVPSATHTAGGWRL